MCVVTSTIVSTIVPLVISSISAAISIKQAVSASNVQKYQAKQSILQAEQAERNAMYERQEGIEDARQKRLEAIRNVETRKTMIASGNIMTSSATALNIFDDEKLSGEIDALSLIDSSEKRAQSYLDSAQNHYSNAKLKKYQSANTLTNAVMTQAVNLGSQLSKMTVTSQPQE